MSCIRIIPSMRTTQTEGYTLKNVTYKIFVAMGHSIVSRRLQIVNGTSQRGY